MSKYTRRGQETSRGLVTPPPLGITSVRQGEVSAISIDLHQVAPPQRTFRADTALFRDEGPEYRLIFGQLRGPSRTRLQSAVTIIMPRKMLNQFTAKLAGEPAAIFHQRLANMVSGQEMIPFPPDVEDQEFSSVSFSAQLITAVFSDDLGSVIDFFAIPLLPSGEPPADLEAVLRINCSPVLVKGLVQWCQEKIPT